jgi:hypothetical protein
VYVGGAAILVPTLGGIAYAYSDMNSRLARLDAQIQSMEARLSDRMNTSDRRLDKFEDRFNSKFGSTPTPPDGGIEVPPDADPNPPPDASASAAPEFTRPPTAPFHPVTGPTVSTTSYPSAQETNAAVPRGIKPVVPPRR